MDAVAIIQAATAAINEGRLEEALAYYDDAVVQRSPATGDTPGFKRRVGKEALQRVLEGDADARVQFDHQRYVSSGNVVAVEGVNRGLFNDVPVEQPVAVFYELSDAGKIASVTVYYDKAVLAKLATPNL